MPRTAERRVQSLSLLPPEISEASLTDELGRAPNRLVLDWALAQARKQRQRVVFAELGQLPGGANCLFANDARGARWWLPLAGEDAASIWQSIVALQKHIGKAMTLRGDFLFTNPPSPPSPHRAPLPRGPLARP